MNTLELVNIAIRILLVIVFFVSISAAVLINLVRRQKFSNLSKLKSDFTANCLRKIDQSKLIRYLSSFLVLVTGFVLVVLLILRLGYLWNNPEYIDFGYFYTASKFIINDLSPYDLQDFYQQTNAVFVHFPALIPLVYPLAYLSFESASQVFLIINIVSTFIVIFMGLRLARISTFSLKIIYISFCLMIYGSTANLTLGNITTICALLIVGSIFLASKNKEVLAGFLLGIAIIKPTLSVLFIAYFLLKRKYVIFLWSLITAFILNFLGLLLSQESFVSFFDKYRSGFATFYSISWNASASGSRIDFSPIGITWFPDQLVIAKLIQVSLIVFSGALSCLLLRKNLRMDSHDTSAEIFLSEVSMIACLSLVVAYSQNANSVLLILVVSYLISYARTMFNNLFLQNYKLTLWLCAFLCTTIYSQVTYLLIGHLYFRRDLPYVLSISIGRLHNYGVLGLMICIFLLEQRKKLVSLKG